MERSEVSIKTRSTPASLSFKGQATKHTTVKWSIIGGRDGAVVRALMFTKGRCLQEIEWGVSLHQCCNCVDKL